MKYMYIIFLCSYFISGTNVMHESDKTKDTVTFVCIYPDQYLVKAISAALSQVRSSALLSPDLKIVPSKFHPISPTSPIKTDLLKLAFHLTLPCPATQRQRRRRRPTTLELLSTPASGARWLPPKRCPNQCLSQ